MYDTLTMCVKSVDLFVCLKFIVPLENFSLIWRRHHFRWRAANFDLCSVFMAIEQWGFLTCHTYCDTGLPFIISEDAWHSHLLPSVWQCSYHYLFLRVRSVAIGDRTPIFRMRGQRSTSTPPRRFSVMRKLCRQNEGYTVHKIFLCNKRFNNFTPWIIEDDTFVFLPNKNSWNKMTHISRNHDYT